MSMMLAVILQAVPATEAPSRTIDFDLRDVPAPSDAEAEATALWRDAQCDRGNGEEIVVCARTADKVRNALPRLGEQPVEPLLPDAEFGLFGDVRASVKGEAVGQFKANAATVNIKVPF